MSEREYKTQAWRTIIRIQKFACQSSVDLVFLSI